MENDNVIRPHQIQWTPGVREIDAYCQNPIGENLERLIDYFEKHEGENNLAVKLLAVTVTLFIKLELLIPHTLLGERVKEDPRLLRWVLFGLCGSVVNSWSAEAVGLFGDSSRLWEMLSGSVADSGEIQPSLMQWNPEGPQFNSYIESPTKENLDRLVSYLNEHHKVFVDLFSVLFSHLINIQDQAVKLADKSLPWNDIKQSRKCFLVLAGKMSNRWAAELIDLSTSPSAVYERLRSLLEEILPP